jgi:hypothetical protein
MHHTVNVACAVLVSRAWHGHPLKLLNVSVTLSGHHIHDELQMLCKFAVISDCIEVLQLYSLKYGHLFLPQRTDFL